MSGNPRAPREAGRALQVRFWGTRGSIPAPGPDTVRYGGNTPCITVTAGEYPPLIFDAGTGIRSLGATIAPTMPYAELDLFLSHTHWDHIQGLPFFAPLFKSGVRIRIWGADEPPGALEQTMRALMAPAVFPVPLGQVGAAIEFRAPPFRGTRINGMTIRAFPVNHPGGALGYRIEAPRGETIVYVPDNELRGEAETEAAELRSSLLEACRGASLLIHDSTYTEAESADYLGWGHSTTADALQLALDAAVRQLVLFHHAPHRTDDEVDAMLADCLTMANGRVEIIAAKEGMTVVVR